MKRIHQLERELAGIDAARAAPRPPMLDSQLRHFERVAEVVPALVWTAMPDGAIDYCNLRWQEYAGQPMSEALGWGWLAMVHPEDLRVSMASVKASIANGTPYDLKIRFRRGRDHLYRWHLARCVPLADDGGRVAKWFGAAVDIHDEKREVEREHVLARVADTLAASLDLSGTLDSVVGMLVPDLADFCVVDILDGEGALERAAAAHVDAAKRGLLVELGQRFLKAHEWHPVGRVLRTGAVLVPELTDASLAQRAHDPEQLRMWLELAPRSMIAVPLIASGRSVGVLSLASSISGRRFDGADLVLAQELARRISLALDNARLYREATEANRLKDEFLATVSHELRTPLNAILGWAQLLRTGAVPPAEWQRGLETIERNARLQTRLIEDLLDVSRIVAGRLRLEPRVVDLADVIGATIESLRPAAEHRKLTLVADCEPQLGEVVADPGRLQQVVWNLVANAVKFTPEGGRVEVTLRAAGSHARLVVADNGRGFDPALAPYLFERFRQADTSAQPTEGGMGLGLAIARHLVELHGGRIWAESPGIGRGATFSVSLPVRARAGEAPDA